MSSKRTRNKNKVSGPVVSESIIAKGSFQKYLTMTIFQRPINFARETSDRRRNHQRVMNQRQLSGRTR